jgi:DNA-directed RNA polymerase subunit L
VPVVPLPPPLQPPKLGVRVAEADLRPNEIQDLADEIGDLTTAAVGNDLKFHLRIELGGDIQPNNEVVEKLNKILKEVSDNLKF